MDGPATPREFEILAKTVANSIHVTELKEGCTEQGGIIGITE